jgi:hypothetical protein
MRIAQNVWLCPKLCAKIALHRPEAVKKVEIKLNFIDAVFPLLLLRILSRYTAIFFSVTSRINAARIAGVDVSRLVYQLMEPVELIPSRHESVVVEQ